MKTAIVTGVCGQDGAYLSRKLLNEGYRVIGWARRNASRDGLRYLGIADKVIVRDVDICDPFHVESEIEHYRPDEIYNLAAQSHVGMSFKNPMVTCQVNYGGYLNVLLAARSLAPRCKIYQAGTSEMFGYAAGEKMANESTPFMPMSPYAISKVAAHWAGINARYEADQFVSNGILFNHESPLRGADFVTRKITKFVAQYAKTGCGVLHLGNLSSMRDWGHSADYADAMHRILQHESPQDFVVATGNTVTVRKFVEAAFDAAGITIDFDGSGLKEVGCVKGNVVVRVSEEFYRPNDLLYLRGDAMKIRKMLGWEPSYSLKQLVDEMVKADMERV